MNLGIGKKKSGATLLSEMGLCNAGGDKVSAQRGPGDRATSPWSMSSVSQKPRRSVHNMASMRRDPVRMRRGLRPYLGGIRRK